jgi:PAS domain S-box-containing protein
VGALFISDAHAAGPCTTVLDDLVLRAHIGFSAGVGEDARMLFGHRELFERAVASKSPVVVSSAVDRSAEQDFLARGGMRSALLVPCVADEECLALLLMASKTRDLTETDWIPFARVIAVQMGQAFSLSRAFSKLEHEVLERKQAESAVRQERDRAQRYLDTAEVILLKLDLEGRIALVNRYGCSVLGWTADELLGRDWFETCLPARIRDESRTKFHDLLAGERSIADSPVLARSGEERLVEWRNGLLRDDEGLVIGTFSSGADITERNQAVEEIQLQRLRVFKATMRTVQDIVNNLLSGLQLGHVAAEVQLSVEMKTLVNGVIQDAAAKLRTLADLETVTEREMAIGLVIDYSGAAS